LQAWHERPLADTPYVFLDARYERVQAGGQIVDCAVLVTVGVTHEGHRRVLGVSVELSEAKVHWCKKMPKLAAWAEENLPMGFAVFDYPPSYRVRLRTTNGLERVNRELKRRTRVASISPNPGACLRLVSTLLAECDDEWMSGKIYLNMNP